jgi:transcriptional regulator with XRE-family HTH domain
MKLGPFIKARRGQLAVSLDHVANAAGLSKAAVHDMETGSTVDPKSSTLLGLAKALKVKPEIILAATAESLRGDG